MTALQGGDTAILHKSEGTRTNYGSYPRTPDRASATIFLNSNYIKNYTSPKVPRQGLCLPARFLGEPGQWSQGYCVTLW